MTSRGRQVRLRSAAWWIAPRSILASMYGTCEGLGLRPTACKAAGTRRANRFESPLAAPGLTMLRTKPNQVCLSV
ncbi:hypothetical protein X994_6488 (plasmid) [Burkholderia pseudomallei]|nr:hypothetical protein X994_6488 [Burkholderia pseudomallei]KGD54755.1 hypothetical protein DP49_5116 [Burkholderia pseudomallei]